MSESLPPPERATQAATPVLSGYPGRLPAVSIRPFCPPAEGKRFHVEHTERGGGSRVWSIRTWLVSSPHLFHVKHEAS